MLLVGIPFFLTKRDLVCKTWSVSGSPGFCGFAVSAQTRRVEPVETIHEFFTNTCTCARCKCKRIRRTQIRAFVAHSWTVSVQTTKNISIRSVSVSTFVANHRWTRMCCTTNPIRLSRRLEICVICYPERSEGSPPLRGGILRSLRSLRMT